MDIFQPTCGTCSHFCRVFATTGHCRKNPPELGEYDEATASRWGVWPEVHHTWWCGAYTFCGVRKEYESD